MAFLIHAFMSVNLLLSVACATDIYAIITVNVDPVLEVKYK